MNKVMNVHYVNEILHFPSVSVFWYFVLKYLSTKFRKTKRTYLSMQVATLFRETATLLGASMEAQDPSGTESQALKL